MIRLREYKPRDAETGARRCASRRRRLTRRALLLAACLVPLLHPATARAQSDDRAEYPVKLGFLYNFAKFVEWPPEVLPGSSSPFEICVVGHDPFQKDLEQSLRGRTVGSHAIELANLGLEDNLRGCHIVFISRDAKKRTADVMSRLRGAPVLTVGETQGFAAKGGEIGLVVEGNRVRFEINRQAVKEAGLKISSKLLALARIVREEDVLDKARTESLADPP